MKGNRKKTLKKTTTTTAVNGRAAAVGKSGGEMKGNRKKTAKKKTTTTTPVNGRAAAVGKSGEGPSSSSSKKQKIDERQQEEDSEEEVIRVSHENGPERDEEGGISMNLTDPNVLDCSICMEPLTPPVFQCDNGHIACSTCCTKVANKCPSCSRPIGHIRCLAIENVIESIKISCKNAQYGCKERVLYAQKLNHEETCIYAPCACPLSDCTFCGSNEQLSLHLSHRHLASVRRFCYNCTFPVSVDKSEQFLVFQGKDGLLFLLNNRTEIIGNVLSVTCIGTSSSKTGFFYDIISRRGSSSLKLQSYTKFAKRQTEDSPMDFLLIPNDFNGLFGQPKFDVCIWSSREYSSEQVSTQQTDMMHSRNLANSDGDDQSSVIKKCAGCGEWGLERVQTWGYCNLCTRLIMSTSRKRPAPKGKTTTQKACTKRAQEPTVDLYKEGIQCYLTAQDKINSPKFMEKKIEFGRRVSIVDLIGYGIHDKFGALGWTPLMLLDYPCYPSLVPYFYANLHFEGQAKNLRITSLVRGTHINFGLQELADILEIPNEGPLKYMTPRDDSIFTQAEEDEMHLALMKEYKNTWKIKESDLRPIPRVLSRIVQHNLYPRGGQRDKQRLFQTYLTYCLYFGKMTNLPYVIMNHMISHCGAKGKEVMPYGIILTPIFHHFGVNLSQYINAEEKEYKFINRATLSQMTIPLVYPEDVIAPAQAPPAPPAFEKEEEESEEESETTSDEDSVESEEESETTSDEDSD